MDSRWKAEHRGSDSRFWQWEDHETTGTDSWFTGKCDLPNSSPASTVKTKWIQKNQQKQDNHMEEHSPVAYEQACRVTGCLQSTRRQQVLRQSLEWHSLKIMRANLTKSTRACVSKGEGREEERKRETDGVCCWVPSLWNLGYGSTAGGPVCDLHCAGQPVLRQQPPAWSKYTTAELSSTAVYDCVQADCTANRAKHLFKNCWLYKKKPHSS